MQFSHTHKLSKERWILWLVVVFKCLILLSCSAFIFQKVSDQKIQISTLAEVLTQLSSVSIMGLGFCLLLMPLNWSFEAIKWKYLLNPITKISFIQSLKAIVSGLALGFATPRSIGDYFGRIIYLIRDDRAKAIIPTIISRVSQFVPTLIAGIFGTIILINIEPSYGVIFKWIILMLMASSILLVLLRNPSSYLAKLRIRSKGYLDKLRIDYKWKDLAQVVALSSIRYLVFTTQFVLALWIFNVEASLFVLLAGVSWVFLAKSILPSFNYLSDLGIREFSAILFFESLGIPITPVLVASLFIWFINILVPSILGLIFMGFSKLDLWS